MIYVVGSGPSGTVAANTLLERGYAVTILDYANDLDNSISNKIAQFSIDEYKQWINSANTNHPQQDEIPLKLSYGSDFAYADGLTQNNIIRHNCDLSPSMAKGGLSNVWGAAILPYINKDIKDWPITTEDLKIHYQATHKLMDVAAVSNDALSHTYPIYGEVTPPHLSNAAKHIIGILSKQDTQKHGIEYGYARNAYNGNECVDCLMCMHGCPKNIIFNSKSLLNKLFKHPNFKYIPGILVKGFKSHASHVEIVVQNKHNLTTYTLSGDRLILAAGVLGSTKIVLSSLKYTQPIKLCDSQYFLLPLLNTRLKCDQVNERTNTLSQIFIEINEPQISKYTVHLQLYGYNDLLRQSIQSKLKPIYHITKPIINYMLNRTSIIQGYFHSNECNKIDLVLNQDNQLVLSGQKNNFKIKMQLIQSKLRKIGLGYSPIFKLSNPGRGFHSGGTLPMSLMYSENKLNTDIYGRLQGIDNVHIVDASILPSIPAQTITYTIMANTHRICSHI